MPRIKKLSAVLGSVGVVTALSASGASAFNTGAPPGPPLFTGTPNGAHVCHQTDPPQGAPPSPTHSGSSTAAATRRVLTFASCPETIIGEDNGDGD